MELEGFDWGWMDHPKFDGNGNEMFHYGTDCWGNDVGPIPIGKYHKDSIIKEIFYEKLYEKYHEVQEGYTVLDVGASVGPLRILFFLKIQNKYFQLNLVIVNLLPLLKI